MALALEMSRLLHSSVSLLLPLPDVGIATDAAPFYWAFYFQSSGFPYSVVEPGEAVCARLYNGLYVLQAMVLRLCKLVSWLPGEVIALHLDNSTAKAYLCNQGGTASTFPARLVCNNFFSLPKMHVINLLPTYLPTHLGVEAFYLSQGRLVPEWYLLPHIAEAAFQLWGQLEMDLLASSDSSQCQHYYSLESTLPQGALRLSTFQPS